MRRFLTVTLLIVTLCLSSGPGRLFAQQGLDDLLRVVPDDANVLMIIRVGEILKTPKAVREGWARSQEEVYLAGTEAIPPWVSEAVRATHLNLEDSSSIWSVAAARTTDRADLPRIARHHAAEIETIGNAKFIKTEKNSYVTVLGPRLVAAIYPAFRQNASRWLRFAASNSQPKLSSYLLGAAAKNTGSPVVLAVDTQDMLDPQSLRNWLSSTRSLAGDGAQTERLARLFENLRGITLAVTLGEATSFALSLDFGVRVEADGELVRKLLVEYLQDSGAAFDDFDQAQVGGRDQTVTLSGPLSDRGLRGVFSLVASPNPHAASMESPPPVPQEQIDARRTRQASEQYFNAVNTLLDDLSSKNTRATNYERTAAWHDSYASKIDSLSLRNVDPELADYGKVVGQRLRAVGASLRGVALRLNTAQNEFVIDYSVNPGQFGGWGPGAFLGGAAMYSPPTWRATSNLQQVREKQARAVEEGAEQREQIWQSITDSRQKVRQMMYAKFGADFGGGR